MQNITLPSHPAAIAEVFFQMVKWYWAPHSLARQLLELYPNAYWSS